MSIEVLQATSSAASCLGATSRTTTCLPASSQASSCLSALASALAFFLQSAPTVEIFQVDFGQVVVGDASDVVVICRNTGTFVLYLCDFLIEGDGFSYQVLPADGTELEPGEEALVTIRFAPTI